MHKGISAIVIVLIGLLAIAGCGGGDSSLSKAEYTQQLELVCNKGLKDREEFLRKVAAEYKQRNRNASAKEQAEEQATNIKSLMAVYRTTTEEIADIGLPEQDQKMAEELVKQREAAVKKIESDPANALAHSSTIFAKANEAGKELEVSSCAK